MEGLAHELNASALGVFSFPETGQFSYNSTTQRYTYGTVNVAGGPIYYPECSSGITPCQSSNSIMADPAGMYDDWPEDGGYGDQGNYQGIVWPSTYFAAIMARAIPALRPIIYIGTKTYAARIATQGTYTNTAVTAPIAAVAHCSGGANNGRVCRENGDCGGGSAFCAKEKTFGRHIWPAVNVWETYNSCMDAKTCSGMEGL